LLRCLAYAATADNIAVQIATVPPRRSIDKASIDGGTFNLAFGFPA